MKREIKIACPHCSKPLPKKIGNIEIKNTDQLIGVACPSCNKEITKSDVAVMDKRIKSEIERFKKDVVADIFKKSRFKLK